ARVPSSTAPARSTSASTRCRLDRSSRPARPALRPMRAPPRSAVEAGAGSGATRGSPWGRARTAGAGRASVASRGWAPFSQRGLIALAGPDADRGLDRCHEDLSVADVAGLRGGRHDLGDLVDELVGHDHLDLDLREEIDRVLAAAVQLCVALL